MSALAYEYKVSYTLEQNITSNVAWTTLPNSNDLVSGI
jgi:hypothetical protein